MCIFAWRVLIDLVAVTFRSILLRKTPARRSDSAQQVVPIQQSCAVKAPNPHLVMNCFVYRNKSSFVSGLTLRFCALRAELVLQKGNMTLQMLKPRVVYAPVIHAGDDGALVAWKRLPCPGPCSQPAWWKQSTLTEKRGHAVTQSSHMYEQLFHNAPLQILDYCHPINTNIN